MFLFILLCFQESSLQLEDLIEKAIAHHSGLKAHDHLKAGALREADAAFSLDDPTVSFSLFAQAVETRVGPQRARLSMSQNLDWPGRRSARAAIASAQAQVHTANRALDEACLRRDLTRSWFNLYYLQRKLAVSEENLILMEQMENVARARFRTGQSAYAFVVQAQSRLVDLMEKVASVGDDIDAFKLKITSLVGLASLADIGTIVLQEPCKVPTSGDQRLLAVMDAEMNVQRRQEELAHFDFKPSFVAGLTYIHTDRARLPSVPDSGKDPIIASLAVKVPLYGKRNRAKLAMAQRQIWATDARIRQSTAELLYSAEATKIKLRKARRQAKWYEQTLVPQARDALDAFLKAFRTGDLEFSTVLEAETTLLNSQLKLERARADVGIHLADLAWLLGGRVD